MSQNPFSLKTPCSGCPFRGDGKGVGGLRAARIEEICWANSFDCHKTVRYSSEEGDADPPKTKVCGGWLAMLWRHDRGFPGLIALMAREGLFVPEELDVDAVFESWEACVEHHIATGGG